MTSLILEHVSKCPKCRNPLKLKYFRVGVTEIDRVPKENQTRYLLECVCNNEQCEIKDYEIEIIRKQKD